MDGCPVVGLISLRMADFSQHLGTAGRTNHTHKLFDMPIGCRIKNGWYAYWVPDQQRVNTNVDVNGYTYDK